MMQQLVHISVPHAVSNQHCLTAARLLHQICSAPQRGHHFEPLGNSDAQI